MHSCAPEVCFIFPTFDLSSLGIWVGFRVLNSSSDFSHCFGSIVNEKEGVTSVRGICTSRYQLQLKVLGFGEVIGHKLDLKCL
jgi:hypothetical protein